MAQECEDDRRMPRPALCAGLIVLLWLLLYVPGLWSPPLLDDADSVHAEAAREMMLRGDWSTLYVNGLRYLEKSPLLYWGMAASYKVFGATDWAARLPLCVGVLGLLLAAWAVGRHYFDDAAGLYAALAMGLSFGPYIYTRILIPDILVALWLLLGVHCFLLSFEGERPSRVACWGLALSAALNVLTKGLIGVVFPSATVLGYLLLTRNLRHLLRMRLGSSAAIFLLVATPWHIVASIRNPAAGSAKGFFWFYFVNEHFLRYLGRRFPRDYDTVPLVLFWALTVLFLLPWSAFLWRALRMVPWRGREAATLRGRALAVMALAVVVVMGFFSFSTRQEYYVLPALPPLALIVGAWMSREERSSITSPERRSGRRVSVGVAAVCCALGAAMWVLLWWAQRVPPNSELAELLTRNPQEYALSFGHIFDLTPRAMGLFRAELFALGVALPLGGLLCWWWRRGGRVAMSNAALAVMMLVSLGAVHAALVKFAPILSSRTLSDALVSRWQKGDVVVVNGAYEDASTLSFYGHLPLHVLNSRENGNLYYGSLFPDAPQVFEDDASFARLWNGGGRVYVFSQESELPMLLREGGYKMVARSGGKVIVVNER
jgi:4-amino-4-deoxy-L-arabinose transferase-like glycosyltransferase